MRIKIVKENYEKIKKLIDKVTGKMSSRIINLLDIKLAILNAEKELEKYPKKYHKYSVIKSDFTVKRSYKHYAEQVTFTAVKGSSGYWYLIKIERDRAHYTSQSGYIVKLFFTDILKDYIRKQLEKELENGTVII